MKITSNIYQLYQWINKKYKSPSPHFIKQSVLCRESIDDAIWIETGTYLGETTKILSRIAKEVYTIEPEPSIFLKAQRHLKKYKNINVINGTSEQVLPNLLIKIRGNVNFWLDGHYSAGITYQGENDCPVLFELNAIKQNIDNFDKVKIFIDDIRCFNKNLEEYTSYPNKDELVNWCRENNFEWYIEHDILIASKEML